MTVQTAEQSLHDRAVEVLRRAGNPFRNYFARNPDDDVCARYHVPELFAVEREQLLGVVDLYRYDPTTHSEIVPILGNKGSGKTHLLYSIKHGNEGAWQLLVTPGTYQKDTDFLEYLLFQVIDTLLSGGKQKGARPLEFVSEELTRRLMHTAVGQLNEEQQMELFPTQGLGRWARKLGLGTSQAQEKTQWLLDNLSTPLAQRLRGANGSPNSIGGSLKKIFDECGLEPDQACEIVCAHIEQTEAHDAAGLMRRRIHQGFVRAAVLGDERDLANFVTFGFADLDFKVQPSRQDLVLVLFKVLMDVFLELKIPVVVAFDQLEDLLLARRSDDCHKIAETFFAGIVQVLHKIDGICFLIFAERGLWNRFVPSLDGYIQDRINNPVHVPAFGTLKALRLEAPSPELARRVVEARLRPSLEEVPEYAELADIFPFSEDQVNQIARTEPTLRDMLQQYRHLFDHLIFRQEDKPESGASTIDPNLAPSSNRLDPAHTLPGIKSVMVVETPPEPQDAVTSAAEESRVENSPRLAGGSHPTNATPVSLDSNQHEHFVELWEQELRTGRRKLEPDGSLTGATRELQAGLGSFLQLCFEHGVKVGPWRLQHVVGEMAFGEHPTYGVFTLAHWVCKDGEPWKVGIGLFLGRGSGKLRDLDTKLSALEMTPPVADHLILLRPEDDVRLTGKTKSRWQQAEQNGLSTRIEAVSLDTYAMLYAFPRWLTAIGDAVPEGQPLPNLADLIQDRCEKLLEQVCMPCP